MARHECGSCTLCCKIQAVPQIKKPAGKWCPDCIPGKGCEIFKSPTRPQICKDFYCMWVNSPSLPDKYRPDKIKFYVSGTEESEFLHVCVDANYPTAWKEGAGKELIDHIRNAGRHMLVIVGNHEYFIQGKNKPIPKSIINYMQVKGQQALLD